MDSAKTVSDPTSEESSENERLTLSIPSTIKTMVEKVGTAVGIVAKQRNLETSIVLERLPPIDICVFGRSGIGKSLLIKAITHLDIPTSAQIDHVTQVLTAVTTTIEGLTFRFWDTKGVDNWQDIEILDNMFNEMSMQKVQPLFVIYCATANGRADSDIVAGLLTRFREENVLICYVITNIYAGNDSQLEEQMKGGQMIMSHVFGTTSQLKGDLHYEYKNTFATDDAFIDRNQGILIGVNSCEFRSRMGTMAPHNVNELMNFLAGNLNDEEFTKFVILTMANRDFWSRMRDGLRTRVLRITSTLNHLKIRTTAFFKSLFNLD